MTGVVSRTATHSLLNSVWPYLQEVAEKGVAEALRSNSALRRGVHMYEGKIMHPGLAASIGGGA
jgi:alanine dehydrogenase